MDMSEKKNIAVIDIGSNSIRLQVAAVMEKSYRIVHEYKEVIRIGDDLFKYGRLMPNSIAKLTDCIAAIKTLIDRYEAVLTKGVATATLREAENGREIVKMIKEKYGIEIEIIGGEKEARLSFLGVSGSFQLSKFNAVITDIGGGSAEFSISAKGSLVKAESKKLGCSRLKSMFIRNDPPLQREIIELKNHIESEIIDLDGYDIDAIICTGGTINNIANVYYSKYNKSDPAQVKYVTRDFFKSFINEIRYKKSSDIAKINGVEEQRADILLPAAMLIEQLLSKTQNGGFYCFSGGLRTGLIIDTLNSIGVNLPFQQLDEGIHYSRLIEVGNKYMFEEQHAIQVLKLSEIIFNKLKSEMKLEDYDWEYLQAAAILHDIGNYISFSKHHKHSYYLIKNSDLTGFNSNEKTIVANVARYHRRSEPKKDHEIYKELGEKDILKVRKLSAILRVADSLDRSHRGFIKGLNVFITDKKIILKAEHEEDISLEIKGLEGKKGMMENILTKKVVLE